MKYLLLALLTTVSMAQTEWKCQSCVQIPAPIPQPLPTGVAYYIDGASKGGTCNDSNPGTDITKPWCTWAKNMWEREKKLNPGDVVYIRAGVYKERMNFHPNAVFSGTLDKPIVITGYQTERPVFDGSLSGGYGILPYGANNYIHIKNMEFKNFQTCMESTASVVNVGWVLDGIDSHNCERGMLFRNFNGVTIRNSKFHDNKDLGLGFSAGSTNIVIDNVQSFNNNDLRGVDGDADGIWADQTTGKLTITNTTVYNNSEDGLDIKSTEAVVSNVKAYASGACGLKLWNGFFKITDVETYGNGEDGIKVSEVTFDITRLNSHDNKESAFQWRSVGGAGVIKASKLTASPEGAITFVNPEIGKSTKMDIVDSQLSNAALPTQTVLMGCQKTFSDAEVKSGALNTYLKAGTCPRITGSVTNPL